ncbi:MAG TPA: hypothetical protein VGE52_05090 [Pirellulales bacterium]
MSFTELSTTGFGWDAAPVLALPSVASPAREATNRAVDPKLPATSKKPARRTNDRPQEAAWSEEAAQAQIDAVLVRVSRACPADYDVSDDLDCWNALEEAVMKARAKRRRPALALALEQYERLGCELFERHRERQELMMEQLDFDFDLLPAPKYN